MDKYSKLDLLNPEPLDFYGLKIYKPTLKEIYQIGYDNYNHFTTQMTLSVLDIAKFLEQQKIGGNVPTPLHFIIDLATQSPISFLELQMGFFTYTRKSIKFSDYSILLFDKEPENAFILNEKNFNEFQEIILMINKMFDVEEEREIISPNEKMRQKFIQARLKLREAKKKKREESSKKGEGITLPDIISSLCAYNIGYTIFNVWDLTIYQLYDQLDKANAKDEYDKNYAALLAGADPKKIKLKNWMNIS